MKEIAADRMCGLLEIDEKAILAGGGPPANPMTPPNRRPRCAHDESEVNETAKSNSRSFALVNQRHGLTNMASSCVDMLKCSSLQAMCFGVIFFFIDIAKCLAQKLIRSPQAAAPFQMFIHCHMIVDVLTVVDGGGFYLLYGLIDF